MKPELQDEERLTAYALGETDPAEAAELEAQIASDPARQAYVAEVRATAGALQRELKEEARSAGLTATQKRLIAAALSGTGVPAREVVQFAPRRIFTFYRVAATVAVVVLAGVLGMSIFGRKTSDILGTLSVVLPGTAPSALHQATTIELTSESEGATFRIDASKGAAAVESTPPELAPSAKVVVPPDILAKAQLGDHTETINPAQPGLHVAGGEPDANLFYDTHGNNDVLGAGGSEGLALGETKSISHGSFGTRGGSTEKDLLGNSRRNAKPAEIMGTQPRPVDALRYAPPSAPAPAARPIAPPTVPEPTVTYETAAEAPAPGITNLPRTQPTMRFGVPSGDEVVKKSRAPAAGDAIYDAEEYSRQPDEESSGELRRRYREATAAPVATLSTESTAHIDDTDAAKRNAALGYTFNRITAPECPPEPVNPPAPVVVAPGTEEYNLFGENGFKHVTRDPLSTFSLDVDTASYANVRRFLDQNQLPPPEAVRIEELINYFPYHYDPPTDGTPFAVHAQVAECPWNASHRLVKIGVKAVDMAVNQRPPSNLVFLVDVSGSMNDPKRLPLVKEGLSLLVKNLNASDHVAIVTYADGSRLALKSTSCDHSDLILQAIDRLHADGSTNGGEGIQTAYRVACENFITGGVNRVILATDGDFNVGITNTDQLVAMIKGQANAGVFLTAIGCGMGNYKDARLQKLADGAHGNYAYVDNFEEIRKVLIEQLSGTLVTVAKDVKVQVEFNPAQAYAYRLIGYEKRILEHRDFNNDAKDAGDLGAGHTVTALYEVIPGAASSAPGVDSLRYQPSPTPVGGSAETLTVKLRYKLYNESTSRLLAYALTDNGAKLSDAPADYKFAAAVAAFGMLLKHSPYAGAASYDLVETLVNDSRDKDEGGYRREFAGLVRKARDLDRR